MRGFTRPTRAAAQALANNINDRMGDYPETGGSVSHGDGIRVPRDTIVTTASVRVDASEDGTLFAVKFPERMRGAMESNGVPFAGERDLPPGFYDRDF